MKLNGPNLKCTTLVRGCYIPATGTLLSNIEQPLVRPKVRLKHNNKPGATHYVHKRRSYHHLLTKKWYLLLLLLCIEKGEDDVWQWQECIICLCMVSLQVRGGLLLPGDVMNVLCSFDDHTSHTISLLLNTLLNIIHSSGINNIR